MKEDNRKIVVYYSYTGHTRMISEKIKEKLKCDILEIEPLKEYSNDYDLVVMEEQNNSSNGKIPEIKDVTIDLNQYDEIIIGTPVWWYTLAPVIRTFLSKSDLSNKKVMPFATNAGWLGQTFEEIKKLCPNSEVAESMNIVFTEDHTANDLVTSTDEIEKWIKSL